MKESSMDCKTIELTVVGEQNIVLWSNINYRLHINYKGKIFVYNRDLPDITMTKTYHHQLRAKKLCASWSVKVGNTHRQKCLTWTWLWGDNEQFQSVGHSTKQLAWISQNVNNKLFL